MLMLQPMFMGNADERRIGVLIKDGQVLHAKFVNHPDLSEGQNAFYEDAENIQGDDMEGRSVKFFSAQDYVNLKKTFDINVKSEANLIDEKKTLHKRLRLEQTLAEKHIKELEDQEKEIKLLRSLERQHEETVKYNQDLIARVKAQNKQITELQKSLDRESDLVGDPDSQTETEAMLKKTVAAQYRKIKELYRELADANEGLDVGRETLLSMTKQRETQLERVNLKMARIKELHDKNATLQHELTYAVREVSRIMKERNAALDIIGKARNILGSQS